MPLVTVSPPLARNESNEEQEVDVSEGMYIKIFLNFVILQLVFQYMRLSGSTSRPFFNRLWKRYVLNSTYFFMCTLSDYSDIFEPIAPI